MDSHRNERRWGHQSAWLAAGAVLLLTILSIPYLAKASEDRSAILRWRPQILALPSTDIYRVYNYPNPPILPLLLFPIACLPPMACSLAWLLVKVGLAVVALGWTFRLVESAGKPFPTWAKVATFFLTLRAIAGDLSHGNVNLLILFLVVGGLYAFTRGRDLTAGLLIAMGVACKVTPALFIPYFAWKRSWRVLAGCGLGLALFLVVLPGAVLGQARNLTLFASWYDTMVRPFLGAGQVTTDHINQSLPGVAFRLLTASPSFYEKGVPISASNVAALSPQVVAFAVKVCMVAFAVVVVWSCRSPTEPRGGWRLAAEFGLVTLGMLLFSERTWKHHCVVLAVPFAVLVYAASQQPRGWFRGCLVASVLIATGLMSTTVSGLPLGLSLGGKTAEAYGAYTWAFFVLGTALVAVMKRTEPGRSASNARRLAA